MRNFIAGIFAALIAATGLGAIRTGSYTGALLPFIALAIVSMLAMRATLPLAEETAHIDAGEAAPAEPVTLR